MAATVVRRHGPDNGSTAAGQQTRCQEGQDRRAAAISIGWKWLTNQGASRRHSTTVRRKVALAGFTTMTLEVLGPVDNGPSAAVGKISQPSLLAPIGLAIAVTALAPRLGNGGPTEPSICLIPWKGYAGSTDERQPATCPEPPHFQQFDHTVPLPLQVKHEVSPCFPFPLQPEQVTLAPRLPPHALHVAIPASVLGHFAVEGTKVYRDRLNCLGKTIVYR
jgi:hypothetical protein